MPRLDQRNSKDGQRETSPPKTTRGWLAPLVCLGLALAVLVVFLPATRHEFVNYDDLEYVTQNGHVQAGLMWESVAWALSSTQASNWHPLTWLSHMLDCQLYGLKAGGHHLTNLLLHAVNTLLLFLVLRQMTGATWRSAFVAALFGLHPLHVESVAWVAERKDVSSTLFWMLTLWTYALYVARGEGGGARGEGGASNLRSAQHATQITRPSSGLTQSATLHYSLALVCFALGLMAKPMLVTLPFVLLLLDYWPLGRLQRSTSNAQLPMIRRLIYEKLPFFALALASSLVTFVVQRKGGAVSSLTTLSVGARIANAAVSYARYLGKTFWPDNLSVLYPHPGHWLVWQVAGAGLLLAGGTAGALALRRRRPYLPVGWLWYVGTLVPVIGLVQVGIQSMADRYMYVPAIGVFIMLAWGLWDLTAGWRGQRVALATGGAVALACCGAVTRSQVGYWTNSETLFRRAVQVTKKNYLAYNNLGYYLSGQGRV
jgi:hypothetical protein